ncbi:MAG: LysR family transcriptional regulator [Myxococcota bacterium]|nr:LysR family transcriptional regulator [Myxococcota bacterium]
MNISDMDLNLLRALDVLVRERNVTRAGRALGLSQPAMSNALTRLRQVTGDPLLVRSPEGMLPTPRALELAEPVRQALALLSRAVSEHETFVPERATGNFRIALLDHSAFVFMPLIVKRLAAVAPKVSVEALAWRGDDLNYRELQAGEIDLLLSVGSFSEAPAGIYRRRLFADRFVCLVRQGHPLVKDELDLETYCALSHILVSPRGGRRGIVDDALDARGLARRVAVVVPHFMIAPFLAAQTDFIVTISEYVARPLGALLPLAFHDPPLEFAKGSWFQLWHERTHYDPAHKWFRDQVAALAAEVEQEIESGRCPRPAKKPTQRRKRA